MKFDDRFQPVSYYINPYPQHMPDRSVTLEWWLERQGLKWTHRYYPHRTTGQIVYRAENGLLLATVDEILMTEEDVEKIEEKIALDNIEFVDGIAKVMYICYWILDIAKKHPYMPAPVNSEKLIKIAPKKEHTPKLQGDLFAQAAPEAKESTYVPVQTKHTPPHDEEDEEDMMAAVALINKLEQGLAWTHINHYYCYMLGIRKRLKEIKASDPAHKDLMHALNCCETFVHCFELSRFKSMMDLPEIQDTKRMLSNYAYYMKQAQGIPPEEEDEEEGVFEESEE